ncbi:MAG: hypothetical protein ABII25_06225 [bacterium]
MTKVRSRNDSHYERRVTNDDIRTTPCLPAGRKYEWSEERHDVTG